MSDIDQQINEYLKPFEELEKENYELKEKLKAVEAERDANRKQWAKEIKWYSQERNELRVKLHALEKIAREGLDTTMPTKHKRALREIDELMERGE